MVRDATLGRLVLATTAGVFVILVVWINTYPFLDEESIIYPYIPAPQWVLLTSAVWGLFFIGGLMTFTLYHIYPYLSIHE